MSFELKVSDTTVLMDVEVELAWQGALRARLEGRGAKNGFLRVQ